MDNFDLTIIPLHRRTGVDQPNLTGLHAAAPPRRAARGRKADQLIILLTFSGEPPFTNQRISELLTRLEKGFFDTPGSLTTASRDMIEELNSLILNLNLRNAGGRPQINASITMLVVRNQDLYLAQSGPGHLFVIEPRKIEYVHDEQAAGRGLGVSRTPAIHYAQMPLQPGYRLLFTSDLPDTWTAETFQLAHNRPLPVAHRRFMEHAGENLSAAMVDIHTGSGAVNLISAGGTVPEAAPAQPRRFQPTQPQTQQETWEPAAPPKEALPTEAEVVTQAKAPVEPRASRPEPPTPAYQEIPPAEAPETVGYQPEREPIRKQIPRPEIAPVLLNALRKTRTFSARALKGTTDFFRRVLPWDEMAQIPTSYMTFIAVAVPLIVITVAALVYTQRGKSQQYTYYLEQAQTQADQAVGTEDVAQQRHSWESALASLDKAEEYFITDDTSALRVEVVEGLDGLDGVTRLNFTQAIVGSMASSIKIRQMFATSNEIYMLDVEHDQIYRAQLIGDQYEMDTDFVCRSGRYGTLNVEGLIDMAPIPTNSLGMTLVAIDSGANLLYCSPESDPIAFALAQPDNYFSEDIAGITVEDDTLYLLDRGRNMVWYYTPSDEDYQYREEPYFFFQDEVPDMLNALDFAIDHEELYLLYNSTWETTTCTYSALEEALTTCVEPAEYVDPRPGRENSTTIADAIFVQIQHTQPPEPSLYYLDPLNRAIYHFSLRLNLVQQYRPQIDFQTGPITAFAISSSRHIFIALDNQVFMSTLP